MSKSGPSRLLLPEILNLDAYVAVLVELEMAMKAGASRILLDFSRSEKAYPDGVVPLVCTLMRLRQESGVDVEIKLPGSDHLRGVFDGVGWSHYLAAPEPDFQEIPARTRRFTPLRPFKNAEELDTLHGAIMDVLVTQARLATWLPEAIQWALWEVMENVLLHAMAPEGGWVQASTFPETRHINVVVVDGGVGIRGSLSQSYPEVTDREAIRLAVERGVTRDRNVGAGYGLAGCRQIVRSNKGEMIVFSGLVRLVQEVLVRGRGATRVEEEQLRYGPTLAAHHGTIVELELRTDRPVELEMALGRRVVPIVELEHATEDELVFNVVAEAANLGTREAGRELRNRIQNLAQAQPDERIVLDFSGVDMVSSSFADEFVAKLAESLDKKTFFQRFDLREMAPSVRAIVQGALWERLK